jgi:hypothetical protein
MISTKITRYNLETMEALAEESLYEVFEKQVEDRGDGTGQFLWPVARDDMMAWNMALTLTS